MGALIERESGEMVRMNGEFEEEYEYILGGMKEIFETYNFLSLTAREDVFSMAREVLDGSLNENSDENRRKVKALYSLLSEYFKNRRAWIEDHVGKDFFKFYQ